MNIVEQFWAHFVKDRHDEFYHKPKYARNNEYEMEVRGRYSFDEYFWGKFREFGFEVITVSTYNKRILFRIPKKNYHVTVIERLETTFSIEAYSPEEALAAVIAGFGEVEVNHESEILEDECSVKEASE